MNVDLKLFDYFCYLIVNPKCQGFSALSGSVKVAELIDFLFGVTMGGNSVIHGCLNLYYTVA